MKGQLPQELFRVPVRVVHGGHPGVLLAAKAVDQGAVDKAGDIASHNAVQHGSHAGIELKPLRHGPLPRRGPGKVGPVEGQKPGGAGLGAHGAFHVRVNEVDLPELPPVIAVQQQGADLPGPGHGGVLCGVEKAVLNGDFPLVEKPPPIFPHHKELRVRVPRQKALGLPDGVLVIGPRQPLVRGDEEAAIGSLQRRAVAQGIEKAAVHVVGRVKNPPDLPPEGLEIGPGLVQLLPGPAELGGGD